MSRSEVWKMLLSVFVGLILIIATYYIIVLLGMGLFWLISKISFLFFVTLIGSTINGAKPFSLETLLYFRDEQFLGICQCT